jgi:hypothetical protein
VQNSPGKDVESGKLVFTVSFCVYSFSHLIVLAIKAKFKKNPVVTWLIFGVGGIGLSFFFLITSFCFVLEVHLMGVTLVF